MRGCARVCVTVSSVHDPSSLSLPVLRAMRNSGEEMRRVGEKFVINRTRPTISTYSSVPAKIYLLNYLRQENSPYNVNYIDTLHPRNCIVRKERVTRTQGTRRRVHIKWRFMVQRVTPWRSRREPGRAVPEGQCRHHVMTFRMGRHNGPDPRRIK